MKRLFLLGLALMLLAGMGWAQSPFANSGFKVGHVDVSSSDLYGMFPAEGVLVRVTSVTSATVFKVEGLAGFVTGSYGTATQVDSLFTGNYVLRGVSCFTTANEGVAQTITAYNKGSGQFTTTAWGTALIRGDILALVPVSSLMAAAQYIRVDTGVIVSNNDGVGWDSTMFHTVLNVTGIVRVQIMAEIVTDLAGATATVALGVAGMATAFIAATTATELDAGVWYNTINEATVTLSFVNAVKDLVSIGDDVGLTVGTADLSGGRIIFHCWVTPLATGAGAVAGTGL